MIRATAKWSELFDNEKVIISRASYQFRPFPSSPHDEQVTNAIYRSIAHRKEPIAPTAQPNIPSIAFWSRKLLSHGLQKAE